MVLSKHSLTLRECMRTFHVVPTPLARPLVSVRTARPGAVLPDSSWLPLYSKPCLTDPIGDVSCNCGAVGMLCVE
jgi:hypothetical protein